MRQTQNPPATYVVSLKCGVFIFRMEANRSHTHTHKQYCSLTVIFKLSKSVDRTTHGVLKFGCVYFLRNMYNGYKNKKPYGFWIEIPWNTSAWSNSHIE